MVDGFTVRLGLIMVALITVLFASIFEARKMKATWPKIVMGAMLGVLAFVILLAVKSAD